MPAKILIVSHEPVLTELLSRQLPPRGYEIAVTLPGETLGTTLQETRPDLILLDIAMPQMDGIEQCLDIRRHCSVAIIMLSSWGAGVDEIRGLDLSSESYLTEPFGIDELTVRIEETFRREHPERGRRDGYTATRPLDTGELIVRARENANYDSTRPNLLHELYPTLPVGDKSPSRKPDATTVPGRGATTKKHYAQN